MSIFRRFANFLRKTARRRSKKLQEAQKTKSLTIFSKKLIECKIHLLDGTNNIINIESSCLGCDLINQVLLQLDLLERDFFGLIFFDDNHIQCWVDPVKKLSHQLRNLKFPFEFFFRVKFYAIDPDQLCEELTRYHFFLQLKDDIIMNRLVLTEQMGVELSALTLQSELGDYDLSAHPETYSTELLLSKSLSPDFGEKIISKHRDLIGFTPAECEINFLKLVKYHELYGVQRYSVYTFDSPSTSYNLGLAPRGIFLLKSDLKVGFYPWNRINLIGFKRKNIKIFIQNRLDSTIIDKFNFYTKTVKEAKCLWKSAVEHHSFFRLIRVIKNPKDGHGNSNFLNSKFAYSGRTFYEASRESTRTSKRQVNFKRSKSMNSRQRNTVGYIRIGSKVFAKAENGEYFRGNVVALSDKVYVHCEEGNTVAHPKNSPDAILFDSNPDPSEVVIGSRVIAYWKGIFSYLPGNVTAIDGTGNFARYLISFDDGDNQWNNIDQIRLLKPPMYFGPGSNSTYLQKKYSMIKTTTIVNTQISSNSHNTEIENNEMTSPDSPSLDSTIVTKEYTNNNPLFSPPYKNKIPDFRTVTPLVTASSITTQI